MASAGAGGDAGDWQTLNALLDGFDGGLPGRSEAGSEWAAFEMARQPSVQHQPLRSAKGRVGRARRAGG